MCLIDASSEESLREQIPRYECGRTVSMAKERVEVDPKE